MFLDRAFKGVVFRILYPSFGSLRSVDFSYWRIEFDKRAFA